ncbi:exonuclease domain-containing protein, partial [Bifidobacterium pullorum]
MSAQRSPKGFAVVDFETTGINPSGGDRAIEVGIVHVAPDGTLEDEAETLIRVQRDLGASNLHHIHAADLMDAPDFAGIAAELRDWLDGYVFVAHNAVFDSRFLNAEYNRLGYATPVDRTTSICTLRLSNRFLGLRSLDDCCRELGIRNADAHSALGDAHATALLLSGFLHGIPDWEGWRPALRAAAELEWPRIEERPRPWMPRQSHAARRPASPFLNRLQSGNPGASDVHHADAVMLDAAAEYADLLDQCLIDARLSEHEKSALVDMANALGLTREDCLRIHEHYFADVADEAWLDGRLTDDEERELRQVGELLSIDADVIDAAIAGTTVTD